MSYAHLVGVGQTACGKFAEATVASLALAALDAALADAAAAQPQAGEPQIEAIFFANALSGLLSGQECVRGQVALRHTRHGGIPVINVENACASGSSALLLARQAILAGSHETVAVVGAEKMSDPDRSRPLRALAGAADAELTRELPEGHSVFMDSYAQRARRRIDQHGWTARDIALVAAKNRRHAQANELAQYRTPLSVEQVLQSRMIAEPLTLPMCSPIGDGAAALVLSANPRPGSVAVRASALSATGGSARGSVAQRAAQLAREQCGLAASEVDVIEVHDATASAELEAYEHLGLAPEGEGNLLAREGFTSLGGALPINTGGGLLARGHPVGATGVLQIVELVEQLRGRAGARQVQPLPRLALAHNAGGFLEGDNAVAVVTVLERLRS